MAAFLFARALNKTEEFYLASSVDGAGAFDDLVFRYRLREPDVWKTCFIQLKHKKCEGTIKRSSLTKMSGNFSLLKYFRSYCQIKSKASTDHNLKQCGPFDDFEFVIYTNARMEGTSALQGGDCDPVSILSSLKDNWKYTTFDETVDTDILEFFKEMSRYAEGILKLECLVKREKLMVRQIEKKIKYFRRMFTIKEILDSLDGLQSNPSSMVNLVKELKKCDFSLYREFLGKIKIFQCQTNEKCFETLIKEELQVACQASPSCSNSIYRNYVEALREWWEKSGSLQWLSENSHVWQNVEQHLIEKIKQVSESEIEETIRCDLCFNQQHIERLSDAIQQNTVLNIITNTKFNTLSKMKTYQTLVSLNYKNSVFINSESLMSRRKEVLEIWPCKWSATLVIDCEKKSDSVDEIVIDTLVSFLRQYQQKVILISPTQHENLASRLREKLGNIYMDYEDNCNIWDLDEKSQKQILERKVNFQGTNVALQTLVGTDPLECMKRLIDSDVITILVNNEPKLCVGRQLSDLTQYYVPRVLQHHIYLKEGIFKLKDNTTTFAVSGLQADELKKYLPDGKKLCEFVYDERERTHSFKIVTDYSKSGRSTEWRTMKTHRKVGQRRKSDDIKSVTLGNKNTEIDFSESIKNNTVRTGDNLAKSCLCAELEDVKTYNKIGEKIKPEEVRYIIVGNKNSESKFRELKKLCTNVHWIHVEENSFLWRESSCNIDIIRRYINETKCRKHDIESVIEMRDRIMLLVAEPGMGKSTFLSHMEHEIKKRNSAVWVLRINLNEHTRALDDIEFEEENIDKCTTFLWSAAHSEEQAALKMTKKIFQQALEQTGKMVIILDGFDEISPRYSPKVNILIRAIRNKTYSQILVSSRFSYRQNLEDIVIKLAFTLQPFTLENQIEFLEKYWKKAIKIYKEGNLRMFAEKLLSLCSQNFSDKDGEFTGIPLQTMMLGEAFVKEAVEYCSKGQLNLPEKFNLLDLFNKFLEKKCDIYYSEKNAMDITKPEVKCEEESNLQQHMIAALISLFSPSEKNGLVGAVNAFELEQANMFLKSGRAEQFGIIREVKDGKPHFIHRCFAEYFAAKWFTDNFRKCEVFISDTFFNSTYEVTRDIFDRMLAEDSEIHVAILNNNISAVEEFLKNKADINTVDKGGRTALHLAASYNCPIIQQLMSIPGIEANKPDEILRWTPLRYADRTKSWMAMDILLQNAANADDIVLTRRNSEAQEWGQRALWKCASNGYRKLLEFMLNCGTEVNLVLKVHENLRGKNTLLHIASFYCQVEVINILVGRGADINICNAKNETALHVAAISGSVEIIKILLDKGMSFDLKDAENTTPLHLSALHGNLEATKALVERGASLTNTDKCGATPLLWAAYKGQIEVFRYLTEIGADINIRDINRNSALHHAAFSGSVEIIKILLDKRMSFDLKNAENSTPLHLSARNGTLEATKVLVERGASLTNADKDGDTPLLLAANKAQLEVFRYLTEIGADINIRDRNRNTALHHAAISGSVEIINILLDKGMSVDLTNAEESTPLHLSALLGNLEATKALVKRCASLNNTNKYGNTPLNLAAKYGKLEVVRYLTEIGADINIRDINRNTALHHAAISGSVEIIKILLDKGMSFDLKNAENSTPLHLSARNGTLETTKLLVERGASLKNADKDGATPLLWAANKGQLEVVRYLTEIGADINICDINKNTALHHAAISGSVEIIKILLDKGMSVDLTNAEESMPLHLSALLRNLEATKALVERGAPFNKINKYGNTPLNLAAKYGKIEVFRYLTEIGANINIRDINRNTALHHAAISGSVEIIKILLDKGMSVDLTNAHDSTPLHLSALHGNMEATKNLVERGASLRNADTDGDTPLLLAANKDQLEVFRYLTEIDADINICDADRDTALHHAAISGSVEIIKILLDKGMSVDLRNARDSMPLHLSALHGNLEATKFLVERGASLTNADKYGATPLLWAAYKGQLEVFHYLTEIGADINIRDINRNSALHHAAFSGCAEIIKILLDKGMSVDLKDAENTTPLHLSALHGNLETTKILVERGASLTNADKDGDTPLLLAANKGQSEIFRYLTEIGADINIRDINRNSALHHAAISGSVEIIKILLDKGMSVDLTNAHDSAPLHLSALHGNLEAMKALVQRGASLTNADKYGATPLLWAAYRGELEVFHYLIEIGADINIRDINRNSALHHAAFSGCAEIIKNLLDKGMSVDLRDAENTTPLHLSALHGNLEATKILAERGASLTNTDKDGDTPLLLAANKGQLEVFRYLTEIGADINIRDINRNSALHHAAISGSVEIINILLDKGMYVDLTNASDSTPVHLSALHGNLEAMKALVKRGASLTNANRYGATPLILATSNGNLEAVRYLTEMGAGINYQQ